MPVRKPGKLPWRSVREEYQLEYGTDALEMHEDALGADARVLVVDDVLATGGTAAATRRLVERAGGAGVAFGRWIVDGRFTYGLSDTDADTDDDVKIRNRAFSMSMGFRF